MEASSEADLREAQAEAKRRGDAADAVKQAAAEQEGYVAEQQAEVAPRGTATAPRSTQTSSCRQRSSATGFRTEAEGEKQKDILRGAKPRAMRCAPGLAGEAMGRMEILTKMADGLREIVNAAGGDPDKAASLMIVDKLEEIAGVQANAISNIDFEKIVVYDGGNGNAVGSFLSGLTKALPPFHEVARMAGIELPEFLGEMAKDGAAATVPAVVEAKAATSEKSESDVSASD